MRRVVLGKTGIEVTELCFGSLPMGPLQKNMPVEEAAEVIAHALEQGINFVDTAQGYKTYPHIRRAMDISGIVPIIASKSHALSYDDMKMAIEQALEALDLPHLDIFYLHAPRASTDVFNERSGAFKCLLEYREKGKIKAVGISTHAVDVTNLAATHPEIDMVYPILNRQSLGILTGTREDMENAINKCHENGKGLYLMKVLGGGGLIGEYKQSMDYAMGFTASRFPISMGMVTKAEVDMNLKYFRGEDISNEIANTKLTNKTFAVFRSVCTGCKKCIEACPNHAISMDSESIADIDAANCLGCGYCIGACPRLAIRLT
ncbi:MAG: aldo/keto reductase [Clostridiales bacterium]|nr:aldo/keto reductase [Clostridiales bacterium]